MKNRNPQWHKCTNMQISCSDVFLNCAFMKIVSICHTYVYIHKAPLAMMLQQSGKEEWEGFMIDGCINKTSHLKTHLFVCSSKPENTDLCYYYHRLSPFPKTFLNIKTSSNFNQSLVFLVLSDYQMFFNVFMEQRMATCTMAILLKQTGPLYNDSRW